MLIRLLGVGHFVTFNGALLLVPTSVDALEAPLHTATAGNDWLAVDHNPNRIRMGGSQNPQGDPAGTFNGNLEGNLPQRAIRDDICFSNRITIDDEFQRHFSPITD